MCNRQRGDYRSTFATFESIPSLRILRCLRMAGMVIGAGYGAVRGFFDAFLARDSTWMDIVWSTVSGAYWGGAAGLLFGYAMPFIALGGPWAVGGVVGAGGLFAAYNTVQSVREAWAAGNPEQAIFRGIVGTIETVLSVFAVHRAFSMRYGPKTANLLAETDAGTPLPGKKTMGFLRMILRRMGVKDIVVDDSVAPGMGQYDGDTGVINVNPKTGFSGLVHEIMHAMHNRHCRNTGENSVVPSSCPLASRRHKLLLRL